MKIKRITLVANVEQKVSFSLGSGTSKKSRGSFEIFNASSGSIYVNVDQISTVGGDGCLEILPQTPRIVDEGYEVSLISAAGALVEIYQPKEVECNDDCERIF